MFPCFAEWEVPRWAKSFPIQWLRWSVASTIESQHGDPLSGRIWAFPHKGWNCFEGKPGVPFKATGFKWPSSLSSISPLAFSIFLHWVYVLESRNCHACMKPGRLLGPLSIHSLFGTAFLEGYHNMGCYHIYIYNSYLYPIDPYLTLGTHQHQLCIHTKVRPCRRSCPNTAFEDPAQGSSKFPSPSVGCGFQQVGCQWCQHQTVDERG